MKHKTLISRSIISVILMFLLATPMAAGNKSNKKIVKRDDVVKMIAVMADSSLAWGQPECAYVLNLLAGEMLLHKETKMMQYLQPYLLKRLGYGKNN